MFRNGFECSISTPVNTTPRNTQPNTTSTEQVHDRVSDLVPNGACHPGAPSSSRPNDDDTDGGTRCEPAPTATPPASTPAAATAQQALPSRDASTTAPCSLASEALWQSSVEDVCWPHDVEFLAWAQALRTGQEEGRPVELSEALSVHAAVLGHEVAAGLKTESSLRKELSLLTRYLAFCAAKNVTTVEAAAEQSTALAVLWVKAKRAGKRVSVATQHNRRSAGTSFWRTLRTLRQTSADPFADIDLPPRPTGKESRPLTDQEVRRLLNQAYNAQATGSRRVIIVGLALAGATQQQLARLTFRHVDLVNGRILIPGTGKHQERWLPLDPLVAEHIAARYRNLESLLPPEEFLDTFILHDRLDPDPAAASSIGMRIINLLDAVGLRHGDTRVKPRSLALWAARNAYHCGLGPDADPFPIPGRSRRDLQAAARVLGVTDLSEVLASLELDEPTDPYGIAP